MASAVLLNKFSAGRQFCAPKSTKTQIPKTLYLIEERTLKQTNLDKIGCQITRETASKPKELKFSLSQ